MSMQSTDRAEIVERGRRLLFSLLKPAVRMASRLEIPLDEVTRLMRLAYVQEVRRAGTPTPDAERKIGVSRRQLSKLTKALRSDFFEPETRHELPRRIEFLLQAGPLSFNRICQLLRPERPEEEAFERSVEAALLGLVSEERVRLIGRGNRLYEIKQYSAVHIEGTWQRRVDGLNNQLEALFANVWSCFIHPAPEGVGRTIRVRVHPDDVEHLTPIVNDTIFGRLSELESRSHGAEARNVVVGFLWAPTDRLRWSIDELSQEEGEG